MTNGVFTLLFNPRYLPGAVVLALALRHQLAARADTTTKLGVVVDPTHFNPDQLAIVERLFDDVVKIDAIESRQYDKLWVDLGRPELAPTFSKVWLWQLLDYDTILYLDADTVPIAATGLVLDLFSAPVAPGQIGAAPDLGFPDIFNLGVMVLKPSLDDFSQLVAMTHLPNSLFDGADQGLLNQYFNAQPDWIQGGHLSRWVRVPFVYNCTPLAQYQYRPAVQHFSAPTVPIFGPDRAKPGALELAPGDLVQAAMDSYHHAAFSYAKQHLGIKLLHFIGVHKPWYSRDAVYAPWWAVWDAAFPGVGVDELKPHHLDGAAMERGTAAALKNAEATAESVAAPDVVELTQAVGSQPATDDYQHYLLDPHQYQMLDTEPQQPRAWDPATEAPPVAQTVDADYSNMEEGMRLYKNRWDSVDPPLPPDLAQIQEDSWEIQQARRDWQTENERPDNAGAYQAQSSTPPAHLSDALDYHYVAPERVFTGHDYYPVHRLQRPRREIDDDADDEREEEEPVRPHDEEIEEIEVEEEIDEETEAQVECDEAATSREAQYLAAAPSVPALFPWERRAQTEGVSAERVFY